MNVRFQPKRSDGRPLWRVIYDKILEEIEADRLAVNDLLTDGDLQKLLDPDEHDAYYAAVMRASRELEKTHRRTLGRVRNHGYKLLGGLGQVDKSLAYKEKSRRNLGKALVTAQTVDHKLLTSTDSAVVDRHTRALGALLFIAKQHDETLNMHAEQMRELRQQVVVSKTKQKATDDEIAELKRKVAAIEADKKEHV